jgi:hypothetical protein
MLLKSRIARSVLRLSGSAAIVAMLCVLAIAVLDDRREFDLKEYVPEVDERTACGPIRAPIRREDAQFKSLVENTDPLVVFKNEEGTGADRLMSHRLARSLNRLGKQVGEEWPGVQWRVTEAWDEDGEHREDSLHYEGRAADLTTSDRDIRKYGRLASLAIESGFDWVWYEDENHVHASVIREQ